jgi:hypothetical protein
MYTLTVPIKSRRQLPKLVFPEQCVHCGKPPARTREIDFDMSKSENRSVLLKLKPSLCQNCIELEGKLEWFSLLPFALSAFVFAVVAFLVLFFLVMPLVPWYWVITDEQLVGYAIFIFSGAGALAAAVLGGTALEFFLRLLARPFFGDVLARRPLTLFSLKHDLHDIVGMRAQVSGDKTILTLSFEREDFARAFAALNGLEL